MVYWADLLYREPAAEVQLEAADSNLRAEELPEIGMRWVVEAEDEQAAFIGQLASRIGYEELASDEPALEPVPEPTPEQFQEAAVASLELLPAPWFIKRRLMKIFLRDVHHYLFDVEFEPRSGDRHKIQTEIRRRTIEQLGAGAEADGKHIVVAHSLGTVIAYDCLKRVAACPSVDGLLTIGSPLGLSEVQDKMEPEYSKQDGFPHKLAGPWVNIYDPLDPVAGFDPAIAGDYRRGGTLVIEDVNEPNYGTWRHSIVKYLRGPVLRDRLAHLLGIA